jgi:hypothetical protein
VRLWIGDISFRREDPNNSPRPIYDGWFSSGSPQLSSLVYSPRSTLVYTTHSLIMRSPIISLILAHTIPTLLMLTSMPSVSAHPLAVQSLQRRSVTTLSQSELDSFSPYTHFATIPYCPTSVISSWTCGSTCFRLEIHHQLLLTKSIIR